MKRGVIASPVEFEYHFSGVGMSTSLSHEMLRYYLLYWDELVIPDNNLVSVGGAHLEELAALDFVYKPFVRHTGEFRDHEFADAILQGQFDLASLLHKDPNVDWVLHQSNSERLAAPNSNKAKQNLLKIKLTDLLPVPAEDVPFNDLVEFRHRRVDEFKHLHELLDDLYLQVLSSPDQALSEKKALTELTSLIDDLDKVTKERFGFLNKLSIEPSYNFKVKDIANYPLITSAADAFMTYLENGAFDNTNTLTATTLGLAIGVVSNIGISIKPDNKVEGINNKPRLSYLAQASKAGLIGL